MNSDNYTLGFEALQAHRKTGQPLVYRGLEKEGLRATPGADIAQSDHPESLGHPLTHAHITTDYSEALLELITDVHSSTDDLLQELKDVHTFVQSKLGNEVLWSGSMPCGLDGDESIRIAEYGNSNIGQLKHVYRQGLGVRYGRTMQSIAGLHFNFSLSDDFWTTLHSARKSEISLQDFKSEQYFALIRNFRRYAWLLMYLFGASPAVDKSFVAAFDNHDLDVLDEQGTLFKPYACSLRMSDLGYHNNAQAGLDICFNTLENFTSTLGKAIKTPYQPYLDTGLVKDGNPIQLNGNILQIENEYYSSIRPKRSTRSGEKPTQALEERGVEYVEVRCLDLNPMLEMGIDSEQIHFMDVFLLKCLLEPSDFLSKDDCDAVENNFRLSVNEGRKPGLKLLDKGIEKSLKDWGLELIESMRPIADLFDASDIHSGYKAALDAQEAKLQDIALTPSAKVLDSMSKDGDTWLEWTNKISRTHQTNLLDDCSRHEDCVRSQQAYAKEAMDSIQKAEDIAKSDTMTFSDYLASYNED